MNYMADVAAMLGVELCEEFQTVYLDKVYICKITEAGIEIIDTETTEEFSTGCLNALLRGSSKVTKLKSWVPRYEQKYYIIDHHGCVAEETWLDAYVDIVNYKLGNCYHSHADAIANRSKWLQFYFSREQIDVLNT